jgi:hypothetical protein
MLVGFGTFLYFNARLDKAVSPHRAFVSTLLTAVGVTIAYISAKLRFTPMTRTGPSRMLAIATSVVAPVIFLVVSYAYWQRWVG